MVFEKRSNVLVKLTFTDISYNTTQDAGLGNHADLALDNQLNYWITPQHSVSARLAYASGDGKGRVKSAKSKISTQMTGLGLGFGMRF